MALVRYETDFSRLSSEELKAWKAIPPAVASDCMNRTQAMQGRIKPIAPGLSLCGQARTVQTMAGDCLSICEAIAVAEPGDVIVVDAGGVEDVAVWGGIMTLEATMRKIGGVVVDGAVRDVAEVRESGLALFAAASVPRGPHHGFGGTVDGAIAAGGAVVRSGDIVLGDDDGVTVVPLERAPEVLAAAQAHLAKEAGWMDGLRAGKTIKEMFGFPDAVVVPKT